MAKKKKTVYELHNEQIGMLRQYARPLAQEYPEVSSIVIEGEFKDDGPVGLKSKSMRRQYEPKHQAFFRIECPYNDCVRGGFDLSNDVAQAAKSGRGEHTGRLTCQGWQDEERINKHRCLLELNYRIVVGTV